MKISSPDEHIEHMAPRNITKAELKSQLQLTKQKQIDNSIIQKKKKSNSQKDLDGAIIGAKISGLRWLIRIPLFLGFLWLVLNILPYFIEQNLDVSEFINKIEAIFLFLLGALLGYLLDNFRKKHP